MTTLDDIRPEMLFVPGLRFWGQARDGRIGIVCQNALGAVEVWTAAGLEYPPPLGEVVSHSPAPRPGHEMTMGCSVLGGAMCFTRRSLTAYRDVFEPLLRVDDTRAVLAALAQWHDDLFAGTRVTA